MAQALSLPRRHSCRCPSVQNYRGRRPSASGRFCAPFEGGCRGSINRSKRRLSKKERQMKRGNQRAGHLNTPPTPSPFRLWRVRARTPIRGPANRFAATIVSSGSPVAAHCYSHMGTGRRSCHPCVGTAMQIHLFKKTGLQHVLTPFLPRATKRLKSQATENNAFRNQPHVEAPENARKYPETMPFCAILCHFVKTIYTPSRNRFYFNHFRSWFRTGKHRSTPAPAEAPCSEPCDCFFDRCEEPFRTRVTAGEEEPTGTVSANT